MIDTVDDTLVLPDKTPHVDLQVISLDDGPEHRYEQQAILGQGGAGEVHLCKDRRLGRAIAMKLLRPHHQGRQDLEARFLHEAYLQGQLEHPAIVPVYDVARTADGRAYFTMKRVGGHTLEHIIRGLREGDPLLARRYSRRKLLSAFSSVCLALDFTHSRGVIHRDLKPGNLMLGDFGEVYVLDWGIAKVLEPTAVERDTPVSPPRTAEGSMIGTPGFMAPEQLNSQLGPITPATDVYALGAILFELLALESLHPRGTLPQTVMSTLAGVDARPSIRAPQRELPPELDAVCAKATARDPAQRYPSARALSDAIERFLDGDLDLEKRKQSSEALVAAARATLAGAGDEHQRRGEAMQQLARALALDPANQSTVGAMVEVLLNPPETLPPEAEAELRAEFSSAQRAAAQLGSRGLVAFAFGALLFFAMGIADWPSAIAAFTLSGVTALSSVLDSRAKQPGTAGRVAVLVSSALGLLVLSRVAGPLFFAPTLVLAMLIPMAMTSPRAQLYPLLALGAALIVGPLILEYAGLLARSYEFVGGALCVRPQMVRFGEPAAVIALAGIELFAVLGATLISARVFGSHLDAAHKLRLHDWYLRRLIRT